MADRQRHTLHCQRTSIAAELDVLPISNAAAALAESPLPVHGVSRRRRSSRLRSANHSRCAHDFEKPCAAPSLRSLVPARGAARCLTYDRPAVASHHALERFRRHDCMEYPLGRFPLPTALPARPTFTGETGSPHGQVSLGVMSSRSTVPEASRRSTHSRSLFPDRTRWSVVCHCVVCERSKNPVGTTAAAGGRPLLLQWTDRTPGTKR